MVSLFGRPGHKEKSVVEQRGNTIHEMPEYATELGKVESLSLEELKRQMSQLHSVEEGFDFKVSTIKPWLDTRNKTFQSIPISVHNETRMIADEKPRKLLREYVIMEQILERVKQEHSLVSKGWLAQAKENLRGVDTIDKSPMEKKIHMTKVPSSRFMCPSEGKKPFDRFRLPPLKKDLPGCARCGKTTGYDNEKGKTVSTSLCVLIGGWQKLQVCRACFKIANVQAAKPHSMKIIKMKDRLDLNLSKIEGQTFLKDHLVSKIGKATPVPIQKEEQVTYENKGQGTDADPILLSSSDDEAEEKKKGISPRCKAVVNPCQRQTRRSSKVETDSVLDSLKCSMPPEGGLGAVIFMLRDYMKLRPFEFMNDSCIDYFFKSVEVKLKEEDPEKGKRCYFFNSFFYKKLTDDTSVSILSEETKALAERPLGELDRLSLQALRCYDVTKRWTKNVDLFSKDFLFIPIHDQLHWSLVIVCHPGSGGIKTHEPNGPEAFMLHLDSMKQPSGHNSNAIGKLIKRYLQNEWKAKLLQDGESVPKLWVQEHPLEIRDFMKMVMRRPQVPVQDNHYDCGSFVCAFLDYFIAGLPNKINTQMVPTVNKSRFFQRKKFTFARQPRFLSQKWFEPDNASNLRHHLAITVLKAMAVNAGVMDTLGRWKMEDLSQEQQHKMTFLIHRLDTLNSENEKYCPPSWNSIEEDEEDDDDDEDEDDNGKKTTSKIHVQSDTQEINDSQESDPIEDVENGMNPIQDEDDEEIEIEDVETEEKRAKPCKDTPHTPIDDRAKLRQIKKRKDLRNTPDVDVISQYHDGGEIEVFSQDSPVKFSKRKNKFARRSNPSRIGRAPVNRVGLAETYNGMAKEVQDKMKSSFHRRST